MLLYTTRNEVLGIFSHDQRLRGEISEFLFTPETRYLHDPTAA